MKIFLLVLLTTIIIPRYGYADERHHHEITNISINQTNGIALSLAVSAPQYDYNVEGLQIGIGGGWYDDNSAMAFGAGKRTCFSDYNCGMFNFTVGYEEGGDIGANVGFTWKL